MFETKYRIVSDNYLGYEAQYKKWWMFWWQQIPFIGIEGVGGINTFMSEKQAQTAIQWDKNGRSGRFI